MQEGGINVPREMQRGRFKKLSGATYKRIVSITCKTMTNGTETTMEKTKWRTD